MYSIEEIENIHSENGVLKRIKRRVLDSKCKYDYLIVFGLAVFMFFLMYTMLGYAKYGLKIPYGYGGGDDFAELVITKLLGESFWNWYNPRIGAPFGNYSFDVLQNFLNGFDLLIAKVIYIFTDDAVVVQNMRFLLIFPISVTTSYGVMRYLKINYFFASFGAIIFSMSPYIFQRNVAHLGLATCYFVPFSVLLCVWASISDGDYLKFGKGFFKNKKNIATIIFAALIANNGFAYYPFFTCFLVCVVAMCNILNTKKIKSCLPSVKIVGFIVAFLLIAVSPALVYRAVIGGNPEVVVRSLSDAEIYSMKIVQLFIPMDGNGIDILDQAIQMYNDSMPLVTENAGVYLGIAGICGFVLSIVFLFKYKKLDDDDCFSEPIGLFVRLNVFATLFGTIGGFGSMVGIMLGGLFRGFCRIAIYMLFIDLCVLLIFFQRTWAKAGGWKRWKKISISVAFACFALICVWDLIPFYGNRDGIFEWNKSAYETDKTFINEIEETLDDGAMVFQLPYHNCPESGSVNNMADYHLYTGYLLSNDLKWSYGGTKGREAALWCRYAASLDTEEMINFVCRGGFTGIYIDARAYTWEALNQLKLDIEDVIKTQPMVSSNGNLIFYNLKDYINFNGIAFDESVYDMEFIKARQSYTVSELHVSGNGAKQEKEIVLHNGATQFGPYTYMSEGNHMVAFYGSELTNAVFSVVGDRGQCFFELTDVVRTDNIVIVRVAFDKDTGTVEFRTFNGTDIEMKITGVKTIKVNSDQEINDALNEFTK